MIFIRHFLYSHEICWNIWLIWIECRFIVSIDNLHWFELQMKTQRKTWFVDIHAHTYTIVSILICILSFFKEIVNGIENCIFFPDWIVKRCLPISEMPIKNKQKRIIMPDNQKKKLHNFFHLRFIRSNILKKWKMFWSFRMTTLNSFLPIQCFQSFKYFQLSNFHFLHIRFSSSLVKNLHSTQSIFNNFNLNILNSKKKSWQF